MEFKYNSITSLSVYLTNNLNEIESHWDIDAKIPVLLTIPYLKALEDSRPHNMELVYGYCTRSDKTLALFQIQIVGFDAEKRLKLQMETGNSSTLSDKIALAIKLFVARKFNIKASILGNLMTAGPYGIVFSDELNQDEKRLLLVQLSQVLMTEFELLQDNQIIVIKDIVPSEQLTKKESLKYLRLNEFTIQPSMILHLRSNWSVMEEYLSDLESKYRTKIKKSLRLKEGLQIVDADLQTLIQNEDRLFELYKDVADAAGFNVVELRSEYFVSVKKKVPEKFKVKLIYSESKLIAFYSYFLDGEIMNAHFVGYSKSHNKSFELYHNMLLSYVEEAITYKLKAIEFARTALEIKSSIGAIPIDYYCYISHESTIINRLVPSILDLLIPVEGWKPRSPFKVSTS